MEITITEVEAMNEQDLRERYEPDFECFDIKGFKVYLVDVAGAFGYSMIVFGDGRQIKWANDYELHHNHTIRSRDKLKDYYLGMAERQFFTDEELAQPLKSYGDYQDRRRFITELLPLKRDFLSWFRYCRNKEEEEAYERAKAEHPIICPPAFGYFREEDKEYADYIGDLFIRLIQQEDDTANNYEYNFNAFYYELGNHEYHINSYQGDYDTLSAFGNIEWHGQGAEARREYYKELEFTDVQIKAFEDAIKKFMNDAIKNDWF